ncbi:hypothetical protein C8R43DRAFT_1139319 [Mycena crocata]|nr:hypothetical protein C8R43DRAFT_1139319 [Mycena crocata]
MSAPRHTHASSTALVFPSLPQISGCSFSRSVTLRPAQNPRPTTGTHRHTPLVQSHPKPTLLLLPGNGNSATIAHDFGPGSHFCRSDCASNTSIVPVASITQTRQNSVRNGGTSKRRVTSTLRGSWAPDASKDHPSSVLDFTFPVPAHRDSCGEIQLLVSLTRDLTNKCRCCRTVPDNRDQLDPSTLLPSFRVGMLGHANPTAVYSSYASHNTQWHTVYINVEVNLKSADPASIISNIRAMNVWRAPTTPAAAADTLLFIPSCSDAVFTETHHILLDPQLTREST